ncbi:alpha-mannosidase 2-like, partial [Lycorma delicatula]|uniref:alpha-mannosidase 2-like n=1 Tax=Lycorma delicatula TaxID=130591 RepID=UPI003F50EDC7
KLKQNENQRINLKTKSKKYEATSLFWSKELEQRFRSEVSNRERFPLKVFIVPFSHNDAGWVRTFREYFEEKSRQILNKVVEKLTMYDEMKFVWSEISFLSEWWKSTDMQTRNYFIDLITSGRLEILAGGWVMPDEACTHFYSLLNQLTEGHQWLKNNLKIKPRVGWSIDPFGHSTTMAYILSVSGIKDGTVIQRVHHNWKDYFARTKAGDFLWKQKWDTCSKNNIITHHLPFEIYSAVKSCGPHRYVCSEYDFYFSNSTKITFKNIKEHLEIILSEYGRSASLFKHNVVMVPLGDDFRYADDYDWDEQFGNYKALIDYLSSDNSNYYNAEIKFGTPIDYFNEIKKRLHFEKKKLPVLEGDFFPYSDMGPSGYEYWTGYYTTRPYWKSICRKVEANLRSAEILYAVALIYERQSNFQHKQLLNLYSKLIMSRQFLSIFQHHDGVTGTSKHRVMNDYLSMLLHSNIFSLSIQARAIQSLLFDKTLVNMNLGRNTLPLILSPISTLNHLTTYSKEYKNELPIIDKYPKIIVIFNPLGSWREDVIRLTVTSPYVVIKDSNNKVIKHQVNPIWHESEYNENDNDTTGRFNRTRLNVTNNSYELVFIIGINSLTLKYYTLEVMEMSNCNLNKNEDDRKNIIIENRELLLLIDGKNGFLKSIHNKLTDTKLHCEQYYKVYKSKRHKSGAYLFKPESSEQLNFNFKHEKFMVMVMGKITTEFIMIYDNSFRNVITIYNTNGPLSKVIHVENYVDLRKPPFKLNVELCIRLKTNIDNGNPPLFYTDSNGYQMIKRVVVPTLGIESNYYPITTSIYIEDRKQRFTVLTKQSHGATSNCKGSIEIMLDRRMQDDDNKGMGEGVLDNQMTSFDFWLIAENIDQCTGDNKCNNMPKLSLLSDHLSDNLIYPTNIFMSNFDIDKTLLPDEYNLITHSLPCGVHLVNMRILTHPNVENFPLSTVLLTVQRKGSSPTILSKERVNVDLENNALVEVDAPHAPLLVTVEFEEVVTDYIRESLDYKKRVELEGKDFIHRDLQRRADRNEDEAL